MKIFKLLLIILVTIGIFYLFKSKIDYNFLKNKQNLKKKTKTDISKNYFYVDKFEFTKIKCPACNGEKYIFFHGRRKLCFICNGLGYKKIRKLKKDEQICPNCKGMGKILKCSYKKEILGYTYCSLCKGTGIVKKYKVRTSINSPNY